jgi:GNAT superfamily N-acetyltransferase
MHTTSVDIQRLDGVDPMEDTIIELTKLLNEVYLEAEDGLWQPGTARCSEAEMAGFVRSGEMVVARSKGRFVGCVRLCRLDEERGELGMLAVESDARGTGLGRKLLSWCEEQSRADGCTVMQLELLVPRGFSHPWKEFLATWYERRGYERERIGRIEDNYPHLAPRLSTVCDFVIYTRNLVAEPGRRD